MELWNGKMRSRIPWRWNSVWSAQESLHFPPCNLRLGSFPYRQFLYDHGNIYGTRLIRQQACVVLGSLPDSHPDAVAAVILAPTSIPTSVESRHLYMEQSERVKDLNLGNNPASPRISIYKTLHARYHDRPGKQSLMHLYAHIFHTEWKQNSMADARKKFVVRASVTISFNEELGTRSDLMPTSRKNLSTFSNT